MYFFFRALGSRVVGGGGRGGGGEEEEAALKYQFFATRDWFYGIISFKAIEKYHHRFADGCYVS